MLILYGDNGSGKTTILKLLFHLLSPLQGRNHHNFLVKTPFQKFSVYLTDGTNIVASREEGQLYGLFKLEITSKSQAFNENTNLNKKSLFGNKINDYRDDYFYNYLSKIKLNLFLIGDDRNLYSDTFAEEDITEANTKLINLNEEKKTLSREENVKKSIKITEKWINEQALKGINKGAENAQNIYEQIIHVILLASCNVPVDEYKEQLSYDSLIKILEISDYQSQELSRFGLMSPLNTKKIVDLLKSYPITNYSMILSILAPYVDSVVARFDALQNICNLLTTFENTINQVFFTNKYIKLHVQDGLKIFTKQGDELPIEVLSSGEKQLLLLFCNTLTSRDKATIFIIDEPEISLNIKWQRQLIHALLELTKGSQIQFILATHSIELLSQYNNHVVQLKAMG